ncbi:MAG: phosphocholine cytidylyltransferase family protein [Bdellovibrionales bacterium]|nr:phosphocholine cytidylyltransferase family protein [Bdellovibrionales bacterium]
MSAHRIERAVIVAAGRSSRLYPLTLEKPKGLLDLKNETLLGRSMRLLRERGIREFAIVVGYRHDQMERALAGPGVTFVPNPFYEQMNNGGSLWCARHWVGGRPFLYLHSDLAYDGGLLDPMMDVPQTEAALLTDFGATDEEAMKVEATADRRLIASSKQIPAPRSAGEWVGIAAFSGGITQALFQSLEQVLWDRDFQAYDTEAFTRMARAGHSFRLVPTDGKPWAEIDTQADYDRACGLF